MNTANALALKVISSKIAAVIRAEVADAQVNLHRSNARGLFLMVEGSEDALSAVRAFVEAHLSAQLTHSEHCPEDEDAGACDFYAVSA